MSTFSYVIFVSLSGNCPGLFVVFFLFVHLSEFFLSIYSSLCVLVPNSLYCCMTDIFLLCFSINLLSDIFICGTFKFWFGQIYQAFPLWFISFMTYLRNIFLSWGPKDSHLYFPIEVLKCCFNTLRFLIYLALIFVHSINKASNFILYFYMDIEGFKHHLLNKSWLPL